MSTNCNFAIRRILGGDGDDFLDAGAALSPRHRQMSRFSTANAFFSMNSRRGST
jgi:hypothetical protein